MVTGGFPAMESVEFNTSTKSETPEKDLKFVGPYEVDPTADKEVSAFGYQLENFRLGTGNYATVDLAVATVAYDRLCSAKHRCKPSGKMVALKMVDKKAKHEDLYFKKFLPREIMIIRSLEHHPHLVDFYEVFEGPQYSVMVMEYCRNGTLGKFVCNNQIAGGGLDQLQALNYFIQLISAVNYIHSKDIVHRDIKVDNCLLDENYDLRLADFGFACQSKDCRTKEAKILTSACGSLQFTAPEVIFEWKEGYDGKKADVYSCGSVLYYLLHGHTPYAGIHYEELQATMRNQGFVIRPDIMLDVKSLLPVILNYRPNLRPSIQSLLFSVLRCGPKPSRVDENHEISREMEKPFPLSQTQSVICNGPSSPTSMSITPKSSRGNNHLHGPATVLVDRQNGTTVHLRSKMPNKNREFAMGNSRSVSLDRHTKNKSQGHTKAKLDSKVKPDLKGASQSGQQTGGKMQAIIQLLPESYIEEAIRTARGTRLPPISPIKHGLMQNTSTYRKVCSNRHVPANKTDANISNRDKSFIIKSLNPQNGLRTKDSTTESARAVKSLTSRSGASEPEIAIDHSTKSVGGELGQGQKSLKESNTDQPTTAAVPRPPTRPRNSSNRLNERRGTNVLKAGKMRKPNFDVDVAGTNGSGVVGTKKPLSCKLHPHPSMDSDPTDNPDQAPVSKSQSHTSVERTDRREISGISKQPWQNLYSASQSKAALPLTTLQFTMKGICPVRSVKDYVRVGAPPVTAVATTRCYDYNNSALNHTSERHQNTTSSDNVQLPRIEGVSNNQTVNHSTPKRIHNNIKDVSQNSETNKVENEEYASLYEHAPANSPTSSVTSSCTLDSHLQGSKTPSVVETASSLNAKVEEDSEAAAEEKDADDIKTDERSCRSYASTSSGLTHAYEDIVFNGHSTCAKTDTYFPPGTTFPEISALIEPDRSPTPPLIPPSPYESPKGNRWADDSEVMINYRKEHPEMFPDQQNIQPSSTQKPATENEINSSKSQHTMVNSQVSSKGTDPDAGTSSKLSPAKMNVSKSQSAKIDPMSTEKSLMKKSSLTIKSCTVQQLQTYNVRKQISKTDACRGKALGPAINPQVVKISKTTEKKTVKSTIVSLPQSSKQHTKINDRKSWQTKYRLPAAEKPTGTPVKPSVKENNLRSAVQQKHPRTGEPLKKLNPLGTKPAKAQTTKGPLIRREPNMTNRLKTNPNGPTTLKPKPPDTEKPSRKTYPRRFQPSKPQVPSTGPRKQKPGPTLKESYSSSSYDTTSSSSSSTSGSLSTSSK